MRHVYFIGPSDWRLGRVKIGRTTSGVRNRLAALQTGSPFPLEVYAWAEDEGDLETCLHEVFAPLRLHGEWFALDYKLLDLVSDLAGQSYGARETTRKELWEALYAIVLDETNIPSQWADQEDAYFESAVGLPFSTYSHDIAWAEYQAERRGQ